MCRCLPPKPPCHEYNNAAAVFVGLVTSIPHNKGESMNLVRMTVVRAYKGVDGEEVEVGTPGSSAACGYGFADGQRYLVYAYRSSEDEGLSTNLCTRTRPLSRADEDLEYLDNLDKAAPGSTIYGGAMLYAMDLGKMTSVLRPMAGMTVAIEGEDRHFEIVTDSEGQYNVGALPAGSYEIRAALPDHLRDTAEHKVKVVDRGCAEEDLVIRPDGRISGKIVDCEGRPAAGMKMELISADPPEENVHRFGLWAHADQEGRYEFELVPPGRYLLGINVDWAPTRGNPYPPTYYPGVADSSEAQVVVMDEGTRMEGFDINLPPKLAERRIRGQVVRRDGSAAAGAKIVCEISPTYGKSAESGHSDTYTDGRFDVCGLDGLTYLIKGRMESLSTRQVAVKPSENMEPIKLVLP